MKRRLFTLLGILGFLPLHSQTHLRKDISLSDPFVFADSTTLTYYLTGTGGQLWKSKDLDFWEGPSTVINTEGSTWMGSKPDIWASELFKYKGKYYNFSTFTNKDATNNNGKTRRASHILVSDKPSGTYKIIEKGDDIYLPADICTLDATLWIEPDGTPYMVYCYEWVNDGLGKMEYIQLKEDLSGSVGKRNHMFTVTDATWRNEQVTDGPFLFRTQTGRLGMIWTSWRSGKYVQGVAYSTSGSIKGPWVQNPLPVTPDNHGHGMLFRTFDGQLLMSIHHNRNIDLSIQWFERHPVLFVVDDSGDELRVLHEYSAVINAGNPVNVMVDNPNFDYGTKGWKSTTGAMNQGIANNQSGAIEGNFFENWDANSYIGEMYQERSLPNGTYEIKAAAFRNSLINGAKDDNEAVCLFANKEFCHITSTSPDTYSILVHVTDGQLAFGLRSNKKKYKWMGIDNVSIQYYGETFVTKEEIEQAKERTHVYFQNNGSKRYLNCGNSWGTQATLCNHPLDLKLQQLSDGKCIIETGVSNGGGNHYMGRNGYLDSEVSKFTLNMIDSNTCTISSDDTNYWGYNGESNSVSTTLDNPHHPNAQWSILTEANLMARLSEASLDNPVDATFLIKAANYGRNDTRINEYWNGAPRISGPANNMCAEYNASAFNVYQVIDKMPNGYYQLRMQGFYRHGTASTASNHRTNGTEQSEAVLYANKNRTKIMSIFEDAGKAGMPTSNLDVTTHGNIPANINAASEAFSAGLYTHSLNVKVTEGKLTFGVKKTSEAYPTGNWTVFDNFELYYLGTENLSGTENIKKERAPSFPTDIYDISGRLIRKSASTLEGLAHGIYIVNGEKIIH